MSVQIKVGDFRLYNGSTAYGNSTTLVGVGIASAETIGTESLVFVLSGTGIASAEALGSGGGVYRGLGGVGIASAEKIGSGVIVGSTVELYGIGIPTAETMGSGASIALVLSGSSGIASAESFGSHTASLANTIIGVGIPSAERCGFGALSLGPLTISGVGIATRETCGSGTLASGTFIVIVGAGIASSEAEGVGTIQMSDASNGNAFINMNNFTALLPDQQLATLAGVDVETIRAFRTSTPSWKIKKYYRKVAKAIGCDPTHLYAVISKAERKVIGRSTTAFPSSTPLAKAGMSPKK